MEQQSDSEARGLAMKVAGQLANSPTAQLDARWLIGLAIGRNAPVFSHEQIALDAGQQDRLSALITERQAGKPISRMRGLRSFYQHDFYLNSATLDPRPDSEIMVETAINWAEQRSDRQLRMADLGTGTGCLLLSVLDRAGHATGIGVDCQPLAIAQARANAACLSLAKRAEFVVSDWCAELDGKFDLILANPPYISAGDSTLSDDVRCYDPEAALFAGEKGLDAYHRLLPQLPALLAQDSLVLVEIGAGQQADVTNIAMDAGLSLKARYSDLGGHIRVLAFAMTEPVS